MQGICSHAHAGQFLLARTHTFEVVEQHVCTLQVYAMGSSFASRCSCHMEVEDCLHGATCSSADGFVHDVSQCICLSDNVHTSYTCNLHAGQDEQQPPPKFRRIAEPEPVITVDDHGTSTSTSTSSAVLQPTPKKKQLQPTPPPSVPPRRLWD